MSDVKHGTVFFHKDQIVADVHNFDTKPTIMHSSVVSWYSVHITMMLAPLNSLNILCNNFQNSYLNFDPKQ